MQRKHFNVAYLWPQKNNDPSQCPSIHPHYYPAYYIIKVQ